MAVNPPRPLFPSLNALRAFEAAARHESFIGAAAELGVTPAAVAQQIKKLEEWAGRPLFRRLARGLRLTADARAVLPHFSEAFDKLGSAVHVLKASTRPTEIQIAALPSIAQLWLSPRLGLLRRAFPKLEISVVAMEEPPDFSRELFDVGLFFLAERAARMSAEYHHLRPADAGLRARDACRCRAGRIGRADAAP